MKTSGTYWTAARNQDSAQAYLLPGFASRLQTEQCLSSDQLPAPAPYPALPSTKAKAITERKGRQPGPEPARTPCCRLKTARALFGFQDCSSMHPSPPSCLLQALRLSTRRAVHTLRGRGASSDQSLELVSRTRSSDRTRDRQRSSPGKAPAHSWLG